MGNDDRATDVDALLDEVRLTRSGLLRGGLVSGVAAVAAPAVAGAAPRRRTRELWVAAVPTYWNVVPNGRNAIEGERYRTDQTVIRTVISGASRRDGGSGYRTCPRERLRRRHPRTADQGARR